MKMFGKAKGEREEEPRQKGRFWRWAAAAAALLIAVAGAAYVWAQYLYHDIYPNVYVDGVPVGQMSSAEAESVIGRELGGLYKDKSLEIMMDGNPFTVSAGEAGVAVDAKASADEAMRFGRSGSVFSRIGSMLSLIGSKREISPGVSVDRDAVNKMAEEFTRKASREKRECSYTVEKAGIRVKTAQTGLSYDAAGLADLIAKRFEAQDYSVLEYAGTADEPEPLDIDALYEETYVEPRDARLSEDNGENTILDSVDGVRFDKQKAEESLKNAEGGEVFIPFIVTKPSITKAQFEAALFRDVLTDTYTRLTNPGLVNRTHNVNLAAGFINGKILLPGEEFSYNDTVGRRTVERGFRDAKVFVKGEIVDDIGGGICQVSSTLYMAALFSNLEITQRTNHSFIVDYTKLGEDATVYYGSVDFRFRNNTEYPIKIECRLDSPYLKVKIYGTKTNENTVSIERVVSDAKPYEKTYKPDSSIAIGARKIDVYGHTGYTVNTYRIIKDAEGNVISRKFEAKSVYKKLDEVILVNPADSVLGPAQVPVPSPSAEPTPTPTPQEPSPSAEPTPQTPTPEPTAESPEEPSPEPSPEPEPEESEAPPEEDLYNQPV